jgi:putative endonuclease
MENRSRQQIGLRGEDLAVAELERQGMVIIDRNWRCRAGEIDIVAVDLEESRRSLVFCEVKCRTGLGFGAPLEAITYAKVRKLRQLAAEWLQANDITAGRIRLDAIGVVLLPHAEPQLSHVRGIGG